MDENSAIVRGRCHRFEDDMAMDTDVLPHKYALVHPFDAEKLVPHLFETVRPGFHEQVQRGDLIIAGKNFAKGKPHPQGLIAIAELGLHLLCGSMPFSAYRGAISRGIMCSRACKGISNIVSDGDVVTYDFLTGEFVNDTTGAKASFPPIPERLVQMMVIGGMKPMLAHWRATREGAGSAQTVER